MGAQLDIVDVEAAPALVQELSSAIEEIEAIDRTFKASAEDVLALTQTIQLNASVSNYLKEVSGDLGRVLSELSEVRDTLKRAVDAVGGDLYDAIVNQNMLGKV